MCLISNGVKAWATCTFEQGLAQGFAFLGTANDCHALPYTRARSYINAMESTPLMLAPQATPKCMSAQGLQLHSLSPLLTAEANHRASLSTR